MIVVSIPKVGCQVVAKGSFGAKMNLFRCKQTLTNTGRPIE